MREFFLLERARARANTAAAPAAPAARLRDAARRTRHAAATLVGADVALGALLLDREALLFEARARATNESTDEEALAALAKAIDALEPSRRAPLRRAFDALTATEPLALDEIAPDRVAPLRQDASDLMEWLDDDAARPTPARLRMRSVLRIACAAFAVVLVGRAAGVLFAPPNRALHKPVTVSSRFPDTPDPSGLTDGDRFSLGAHTQIEPSAWMSVDLGLRYKIRKIRIHNRTECCLDESLPLIVEVGSPNDPAPFVAKREEHFDVWEITVDGHPASMIKLKAGKSPGYIALAELEVIGDH